MSNVVWYSNRTNSVGRTIETKTHKTLKDASIEIIDGGYIECQEWNKQGTVVISQLLHSSVNFTASASEALAIAARKVIKVN